MSVIEDYLAEIVKVLHSNRPLLKYNSHEALILEEGHTFGEARLDRYGELKECYNNTLLAVEANPGWRYCEGWAYGGLLPVLHAWALDIDGQVVETTWHEPGAEYVGLAISNSLVYGFLGATHYYGMLGSDYRIGFPLLKCGIAKVEQTIVEEGNLLLALVALEDTDGCCGGRSARGNYEG